MPLTTLPRYQQRALEAIRKWDRLTLVREACPILQDLGIVDPPIQWAGSHPELYAGLIEELGFDQGWSAWVFATLRELRRVAPMMQDPADVASAVVRLAAVRLFFRWMAWGRGNGG